MEPFPTCHPPQGEECETSVEHGLPLWAEFAVGYCSRRPRPSPMWGSRFVGARAVGPWVGEQKPLGKTPPGGNPSPEKTYLPTFLLRYWVAPSSVLWVVQEFFEIKIWDFGAKDLGKQTTKHRTSVLKQLLGVAWPGPSTPRKTW